MIRFCRRYYRNNQDELERIAEFEQKYRPENVVFWYTKESFVYRMINKALRSQDIDQLERFSFLVVDLSRCLGNQYLNMLQNSVSPYPAYCGVRLRKTEVDRLIGSVGQVMCAQGFWSTRRHRG